MIARASSESYEHGRVSRLFLGEIAVPFSGLITDLKFVSAQKLAIATLSGLYLYSFNAKKPADGKFEQIHQSVLRDGLDNKGCYCKLGVDSRNRVYFGRIGTREPVLVFDTNTKDFSRTDIPMEATLNDFDVEGLNIAFCQNNQEIVVARIKSGVVTTNNK